MRCVMSFFLMKNQALQKKEAASSEKMGKRSDSYQDWC